MELREDYIKTNQNVLILSIKSELEECMFESNYTKDSLSDSYCPDDIKIEEHVLQCEIGSPFPVIKQEVKTEIKELDEQNLQVNHGSETRFKNTKELDSDKAVKLHIGASTDIDHEKHGRSMKTSKSLSNIGKKSQCVEFGLMRIMAH
uniref:Uncharacterized protein LOC114347945 isoform X2 n=1 Tax=Diabrotica virgifera virgifera TaxID=50390 RepID=A0A6P7HF70_DIAVI